MRPLPRPRLPFAANAPPLTLREAATAFATVAAIHVPINLVGYAPGARDTPI